MIHVVLGTKAQLVKMGPLLYLMNEREIPYNFVFTGQHRETVDDLRANFSIKAPDVVLHEGDDIKSIPAMAVWLTRILFKTICGNSDLFRRDKAGIVLVHGDTISCLLGAALAKLKGLKVGHVESGLRSHKLLHPFPEELTRILTFWLTDVYFCPGAIPIKNVERYRGTKVDIQFNTLLDSVRHAAEHRGSVAVSVPEEEYCIVSVHRFENVFRESRLARIVEIVEDIASKVRVLFVLHAPTEKKLHAFDLFSKLESHPSIELRPRCDYFSFISLLNRSQFLATDGGSNQEEAFFLGKPCLILRAETERDEHLGRNAVLSRFDSDVIREFLGRYRDCCIDPATFDVSPCEIILDHVERYR